MRVFAPRLCLLALFFCVAITSCETMGDDIMDDLHEAIVDSATIEFTQAAELADKVKVPKKVKAMLLKKAKAKAKEGAAKKHSKKKKAAKKRHYTAKGLFVPKFVGAKAWGAANERHHKAYENVNKYYKKIAGKKFKAQGEKEHKLNVKAGKAQQALYKAKEKMQKTYARDDPSDYPPGMPKAIEKRHKRRTQGDGRNESGSYGASGCIQSVDHPKPCKPKWYPDGAISSNAYTGKNGKYYLGTNRRRVGAGFGRRRAEKWTGKVPRHLKLKIVKGHDLLKAAEGKRVLRNVKKRTANKKAKSAIMEAAKRHIKKKKVVKKAKKKKKLPPGDAVANKKLLTEGEKDALRASGAGVGAVVNKKASFTAKTVVKIIGKEQAKALLPKKALAKAAAKKKVAIFLQKLKAKTDKNAKLFKSIARWKHRLAKFKPGSQEHVIALHKMEAAEKRVAGKKAWKKLHQLTEAEGPEVAMETAMDRQLQSAMKKEEEELVQFTQFPAWVETEADMEKFFKQQGTHVTRRDSGNGGKNPSARKVWDIAQDFETETSD